MKTENLATQRGFLFPPHFSVLILTFHCEDSIYTYTFAYNQLHSLELGIRETPRNSTCYYGIRLTMEVIMKRFIISFLFIFNLGFSQTDPGFDSSYVFLPLVFMEQRIRPIMLSLQTMMI